MNTYDMPPIVRALFVGIKHLLGLQKRAKMPEGSSLEWPPQEHQAYLNASANVQMMTLGITAEVARFLIHQPRVGDAVMRLQEIVDSANGDARDSGDFAALCSEEDFHPEVMPSHECGGEPLVGILLDALKQYAEAKGLRLYAYVTGAGACYMDEDYFSVELRIDTTDPEDTFDLPVLMVQDHFDGYGFVDYVGELYSRIEVVLSPSLQAMVDARDAAEDEEYGDPEPEPPKPEPVEGAGAWRSNIGGLVCL